MLKGPMYDETEEKRLEEKINSLSKLIQKNDSDSELYYERALANYRLSQQYYDILEVFYDGFGDKELYLKYVNEAYNDIEKALSFNEEIDDYAYSFKLFMLKKLKRWDEVIKYGMELYNGRGCTYSDCVTIGEAYFNVEDWNNCIDFYTSVIDGIGEEKANNYGIKIFIQRGIAYSLSGDNEAALKDFLKNIELNGVSELDPYDVYYLIAFTYNKLEKYKEAIDYYTKSIEIYPKHSEAYYDRGKIYQEVYYEYALAATDFDKAIEYSEKEDYFYYHNCGYSYVHKGEIDEYNEDYELALKDFDRAIWAYTKAIPVDPSGHDGRNTVGYAQYLKKELLDKMGK